MFNSLLPKYSNPGGMMLDETDRRIISVLQSDARASMRSIAEQAGVYGAYDVTGEFDSMIIARARDRRDLDNLSKNVISIDGVESSVTHLVLNTVKESSTVLPE